MAAGSTTTTACGTSSLAWPAACDTSLTRNASLTVRSLRTRIHSRTEEVAARMVKGSSHQLWDCTSTCGQVVVQFTRYSKSVALRRSTPHVVSNPCRFRAPQGPHHY